MATRKTNHKPKATLTVRFLSLGKWLLSMCAMAALIFAVPYLLLMSPSPLDPQRGLISLVKAVVTDGQIFQEALISMIVTLGWLCWFYLLLCVVAETVMAIRGVAGYVKGLSFGQSLIRPLIASLWWSSTLTTFAVSTVGAGGAILLTQNDAHASTLTQCDVQTDLYRTETLESVAGGEQDNVEVSQHRDGVVTVDGVQATSHIVREADTLWDLAQRHLGDGFRWREIMSMNPEITNPDLIAVDTLLYLPADAVDLISPVTKPESAQITDAEMGAVPNKTDLVSADAIGHGADLGAADKTDLLWPRTLKDAAPETPMEAALADPNAEIFYQTQHMVTVESGDTLWDLASDILGTQATSAEIEKLLDTVDSAELDSGDLDLIYPGEQVQFETFTPEVKADSADDSLDSPPTWWLSGDETVQELDQIEADLEIKAEIQELSTTDISTGQDTDGGTDDEGSADSGNADGGSAGEDPAGLASVGLDNVGLDNVGLDSAGEVSETVVHSAGDGTSDSDGAISQSDGSELADTYKPALAKSSVDVDMGAMSLLNRPALVGGAGAAILALSIISYLRRRRQRARALLPVGSHDVEHVVTLSAEATHLARELDSQAHEIIGKSVGWAITNVNMGHTKTIELDHDIFDDPSALTELNIETTTTSCKEREENACAQITLLVGTELESGDVIELTLAQGEQLRLTGDIKARESFCHAAALWLATSQPTGLDIYYMAKDTTLEIRALENVTNYSCPTELVQAIKTRNETDEPHVRPISVVMSAHEIDNTTFEQLREHNVVAITAREISAQCGNSELAPSDDVSNGEEGRNIGADDIEKVMDFGPYQARLEPYAIDLDFLGYSDFRRIELNELFLSQPERETRTAPASDSLTTADIANTVTAPVEPAGTSEVEPTVTAMVEPAITAEDLPAATAEVESAAPTFVEPVEEPTIGIETVERQSVDADQMWPKVCVLGPVEIEGAQTSKSSKTADIVSYLAFHRQGATADQLSTWIWPPFERPTAKAVANVLSRTRKALGEDDAGEPLLSRAGSERIYKLSEVVTTDYDDFTSHTQQARIARGLGNGEEELRHLREAISHIRGIPFSGGGPHSYSWADQHIRSLIEFELDEAIHRATELALELGEIDLARRFIETGLTLLPGCEACFASRFDLAVVTGAERELETAMSDLKTVLRRQYCQNAAEYNNSDYDCDELISAELHSRYIQAKTRLERNCAQSRELVEMG